MSAPRCAAQDCGVDLVERGERTHPDHRWHGVWWDHPPVPGGSLFGHTSTSLDPSPALLASLAEQEARSRQLVLDPALCE